MGKHLHHRPGTHPQPAPTHLSRPQRPAQRSQTPHATNPHQPHTPILHAPKRAGPHTRTSPAATRPQPPIPQARRWIQAKRAGGGGSLPPLTRSILKARRIYGAIDRWSVMAAAAEIPISSRASTTSISVTPPSRIIFSSRSGRRSALPRATAEGASRSEGRTRAGLPCVASLTGPGARLRLPPHLGSLAQPRPPERSAPELSPAPTSRLAPVYGEPGRGQEYVPSPTLGSGR